MSARARLAAQALRLTVQPVLHPRVPVAVQRAYLAAAGRSPLPRGTSVTRTVLGGRPSERVQALGAGEPGEVLLVHGGAFLVGPPAVHRTFAAHLSAATGRPVHVPSYRLAPEHPYPAALDDAGAAFAELAARGPVTLVGDSAGGTLALLLALRLRDAGGPVPDALGLVSPLVDLTLDRVRAYRGPDPLLSVAWAEQGVGAWLAGADATAVSPLGKDLAGLPPAVVHVSSDECLRPDGEAVVEALRDAGGLHEHLLLRGLWHDVHLQASLVPEAARAVADLGRALRSARAAGAAA